MHARVRIAEASRTPGLATPKRLDLDYGSRHRLRPEHLAQAARFLAHRTVAFAVLEPAVEPRSRRHFFGWSFGGEYRACVVREPGDDPAALRLEEGVLAGGSYAVVRHLGPIEALAETFAELARRFEADPGRAFLKEYRTPSEVWAYLPILPAAGSESDCLGDGSPLR